MSRMRKKETTLGTVAIRSSLAGATPPSSTPPIGNLDPRSSVRSGEIQPLWSGRADLNRRPLDPQSSALTKLRHGPYRSPDSTGPGVHVALLWLLAES